MTESSVPTLRPYQSEVAAAVLESFGYEKGLTFTVEIARQGGKNEISAQLELYIMLPFMKAGRNLIKCSPTFKPQALISMRRLEERLDDVGLEGHWTIEQGHIIRLDQVRAIFLSADESANVVGNTAHLLLEVDEAQDVSEEKYTKVYCLQLAH